MQWTGNAIIVNAKPHGENNMVLTVFSDKQGLHKGLYSAAKRKRAFVQTGNMMEITWNARLEEHLGTFKGEITHATAAYVIEDKHKLLVLRSLCALLDSVLPERDPAPELFDACASFLRFLHNYENPYLPYVELELTMLSHLGFGLDFTACAATGSTDELIYVSPKSGRAVSKTAGEPYKDKLLSLPAWLIDKDAIARVNEREIKDGLQLSQYFLEKCLFIDQQSVMPLARNQLFDQCTTPA